MSQAIPVNSQVSFVKRIADGFALGRIRATHHDFQRDQLLGSYEKGQLAAPDALSGRVVIAVSASGAFQDTLETWVEAMGGSLRYATPQSLEASVRRHALHLSAVVVLTGECGDGIAQVLSRIRWLAPAAAVIGIAQDAPENDFSGVADDPFDATLRPPLARVRFTLGVTSAITNAQRRSEIGERRAATLI